ncbi:GIY-YIG nuclease family protein [Ligilactobacillus pobuzihii]|uniref:GIY-YIG nuclease family protein n=1 Tax=Ligilactobacillus pobuzihii TaxID=449659 RepID=UPI003D669156
MTNDDLVTGYIYVLKSASKAPQIASIKPLYKAGFTVNDIQKRISNAENESTYLYAPVEIIEEIQVLNLNAESLETTIHHSLAPYQLDVVLDQMENY